MIPFTQEEKELDSNEIEMILFFSKLNGHVVPVGGTAFAKHGEQRLTRRSSVPSTFPKRGNSLALWPNYCLYLYGVSPTQMELVLITHHKVAKYRMYIHRCDWTPGFDCCKSRLGMWLEAI